MTSGVPVGKRHVSMENFDRYLDSRVPVLLPIQGEPDAFIFVDPLKLELGLRIEIGARVEAPSTGLRNIVARIGTHEGKRFLEVVVTLDALFRDAYPILCMMADRVQLDHLTPEHALRATLERMSALLRQPDSISREQEVGLFGELLLLGGLIGAMGYAEAVQSWRGALSEEHDFGLPMLDVEVKTTTSERRVHWIESLTQLLPTRDRPLWMVSHQLTRAGAGHGRSLPDLVDQVRAAVGSEATRDALDNALADTGWHDLNRQWLTTRWARRTESQVFAVTSTFPRLVPDTLRLAGVPLERIPDVRYRVTLDGLEREQEAPAILAASIDFEGQV